MWREWGGAEHPVSGPVNPHQRNDIDVTAHRGHKGGGSIPHNHNQGNHVEATAHRTHREGGGLSIQWASGSHSPQDPQGGRGAEHPVGQSIANPNHGRGGEGWPVDLTHVSCLEKIAT